MIVVYKNKVFRTVSSLGEIFKEVIADDQLNDITSELTLDTIDFERTCRLNDKIGFKSGDGDIFIFDEPPTEKDLEPLKCKFIYVLELVRIPGTEKFKHVRMKKRVPTVKHRFIYQRSHS